MQKPLRIPFIILSLPCCGLLLAACSLSTGSSSSSNDVFTVHYFDDSTPSQEVGHAYVIKGKEANFVDDTSYDYLSHANIVPSTLGSHFVFKDWEGKYSDNTTVDLTDIENDCDVYATFVSKTYDWRIAFYNGGTLAMTSQTLAFGVIPSVPTDPSENDLLYYYDSTFSGWYLAKSSQKDANFIDPSAITFAGGSGAPSEVASTQNVGEFYLDTTLTNGQPVYPLYASNGSEWISLGNLSTCPSVVFDASFSHTFHSFSIAVYASEAASEEEGGEPLATLSVPYGDSLSTSVSNTSTIFSITDKSGSPISQNSVAGVATTAWTGIYSNTTCSDGTAVQYVNGKTINVGTDAIIGNGKIYPKV